MTITETTTLIQMLGRFKFKYISGWDAFGILVSDMNYLLVKHNNDIYLKHIIISA